MSDARYRDALRRLVTVPHDMEARAIVEAFEARYAPSIQGSYTTDRLTPSYHPDLAEVACLSEDGLSYAFHYFAAWRHKPTGRIFYGEDSGCSCPSPWENDHFQYDGEALDTSLDELTPASRADFERRVENFRASYDERREFLSAVAETG